MKPILRKIAAVIVGFVAASVVMMLVEFANGHLFYPELGNAAARSTDPEAIRALLATAPVGAFLVVIVGWILGSFVGGFCTARIGSSAPVNLALVLGALLTLAGIANNLMLPPPAWFWIPSLVVFLPAAYAGARWASSRRAARG